MEAAPVATAPAASALPSHKWLVALAVMLGTTLEVLDTSIVNVSLPHMQGSFSASVDEIAWVLTSYLVANGIMIPMTGWISARFGRKRYFMTSVAVFVAASALCGAAVSLDQMVVFRLLQGAAGAAMVPSSQAILMETFPPAEQQLAMATWGVGLMVAPIMGPTLGGWITDNWNWRWNFYINVPIGIVAFLMVSAFVHDPAHLRQHRARGGKVDYVGIACLVVGLGAMQIVLDRGQRADWFAAPWVIWTTVLCAVCFVVLALNELRFPDPILDLRILKLRPFVVALTLIVAMSFVLYGTGLLMPIFLQEFMGYTAWKAGLVLAPRGLATMASMVIVGQIARRRVDTRPLVGAGFVLMTIGLWTMAGWNLQVDLWTVIVPSIVMGAGMGMIFPTLSATALACVARERIGFAASLYNMMRNTGAAVGIAWMTTMLVNHEQLHQSRLVEHLSVFDAWRLSRGAARMPGAPGFNYLAQMVSGRHQAFGAMYGQIQAQAAMLSFNDIYRILALLMAVLIPGFLLLRRGQSAGGGAASH
ncbi:MAG TPA: DHA2 family efflux MFS transporter permease subunit [Candidatus Binataceae bacterium]|jgi:DHA2 family multidrug resistance protein|nr:DHA2 family efflux MFS transporter permease subunit [Candidatus Binataceae bacterium]